MVYWWNLEGTALEFPTPYAVENRFLVWRGYALIALAVLVALLPSLVSPGADVTVLASVDNPVEPGSAWPHLLGALLMAVLGTLNLVQASRQRALLLMPGQPASLMPEVAHEANGTSPGAPALMQALSRGMVLPPPLAGPYAGALRKLCGGLGSAPSTLLTYLRSRVAHLLLLGGLALLMAVGWGAGVVLAKPLAAHFVALLVLLVGSALWVRHALQTTAAAAAPGLLVSVLLVALLVVLPLVWFSASLPGQERWPKLTLPAGALAFLALAFLIEVLALMAARQQLSDPRPSRVSPQEATLSFDADPGQLLAVVDRELHRRWAEGIPNRRYARVVPAVDLSNEEGSFSGLVLEESQPLVPGAARGMVKSAAPRAPVKHGLWLPLLAWAGLVASLAGGLMWAWSTRTHLQDGSASWLPSMVGLVCLLLGAYAMRVAHLLWSRVEVDSSFIWLDFKGSFFRVTGVPGVPGVPGVQGVAPAAATGRDAAAVPIGVEGLTLKSCVVQARSAYYAAGPNSLGSRTLVSLVGDSKAATHWTSLAQGFAQTLAQSPAATTSAVAAMAAARGKVRERRRADEQAADAPRKPARFCAGCGTPLLVGARFCQHCGATVA